jgi:hypothetical protein
MLQYRLTGGARQTTSNRMGTAGWSELVVILDTVNNTAGIAVSAYDDNTSTLDSQTYVLSNQSLGLDADALTGLQWDLRGGSLSNGAASFKNYFDDFNFTVSPVLVPESSGMLLAGLAVVALLLQRKRH